MDLIAYLSLLRLYCSVIRIHCTCMKESIFLLISYRKNPFQVIKFIPTEIPIARHLKVKQVFILETSFKHNTFGIAI